MSKGFEIEYFSEIGLGPRYRVDVDSGFITRDEVFQTAEGPLSDWERPYPGNFDDGTIDVEAAEEAYEKILDSGLEPGEFFEYDGNGRGFRVQVHGEDFSSEVSDVDGAYVEEAIEGLERALK